MVKLLGRGFIFFKSVATEENLKIAEKFLSKAEKVGKQISEKLDQFNEVIAGNTDKLCEVLAVDLLNMDSLKEILENYGAKDFQSVVLLKGEYDKKKDKRVYFIQKLDSDKKPVTENEILCLYVNNIDSAIQQSFGDKEMVIINK